MTISRIGPADLLPLVLANNHLNCSDYFIHHKLQHSATLCTVKRIMYTYYKILAVSRVRCVKRATFFHSSCWIAIP